MLGVPVVEIYERISNDELPPCVDSECSWKLGLCLCFEWTAVGCLERPTTRRLHYSIQQKPQVHLFDDQ